MLLLLLPEPELADDGGPEGVGDNEDEVSVVDVEPDENDPLPLLAMAAVADLTISIGASGE